MSSLFPEFTVSTARFSPCGAYRYELVREWDAALPRICWLMLNPSTADAKKLDPTLTRCLGFSKAWGYGRMTVANLFALRSTDPRGLKQVEDPIGFENDAAIVKACAESSRMICGWGVHGKLGMRDVRVMNMLGDRGLQAKLHCLGLAKCGSPKHPLYLAANTKPVPFEILEKANVA
jgi:hypothetical protein